MTTIDADAVPVNLRLRRGDDFSRRFRFRMRDEDGVLQPVDLSAWSVTATLIPDDGESIAFAVDGSQKASGIWIVSLTDSQTQALDSGRWKFVREIGSDRRTVFAGWTKAYT